MRTPKPLATSTDSHLPPPTTAPRSIFSSVLNLFRVPGGPLPANQPSPTTGNLVPVQWFSSYAETEQGEDTQESSDSKGSVATVLAAPPKLPTATRSEIVDTDSNQLIQGTQPNQRPELCASGALGASHTALCSPSQVMVPRGILSTDSSSPSAQRVRTNIQSTHQPGRYYDWKQVLYANTEPRLPTQQSAEATPTPTALGPTAQHTELMENGGKGRRLSALENRRQGLRPSPPALPKAFSYSVLRSTPNDDPFVVAPIRPPPIATTFRDQDPLLDSEPADDRIPSPASHIQPFEGPSLSTWGTPRLVRATTHDSPMRVPGPRDGGGRLTESRLVTSHTFHAPETADSQRPPSGLKLKGKGPILQLHSRLSPRRSPSPQVRLPCPGPIPSDDTRRAALLTLGAAMAVDSMNQPLAAFPVTTASGSNTDLPSRSTLGIRAPPSPVRQQDRSSMTSQTLVPGSGEPMQSPPDLEQALRIKRLEAEICNLRRQLQQYQLRSNFSESAVSARSSPKRSAAVQTSPSPELPSQPLPLSTLAPIFQSTTAPPPPPPPPPPPAPPLPQMPALSKPATKANAPTTGAFRRSRATMAKDSPQRRPVPIMTKQMCDSLKQRARQFQSTAANTKRLQDRTNPTVSKSQQGPGLDALRARGENKQDRMAQMMAEMKEVRLRRTEALWSPNRTTLVPKLKRKRTPREWPPVPTETDAASPAAGKHYPGFQDQLVKPSRLLKKRLRAAESYGGSAQLDEVKK